jgi:hypothetical protein
VNMICARLQINTVGSYTHAGMSNNYGKQKQKLVLAYNFTKDRHRCTTPHPISNYQVKRLKGSYKGNPVSSLDVMSCGENNLEAVHFCQINQQEKGASQCFGKHNFMKITASAMMGPF